MQKNFHKIAGVRMCVVCRRKFFQNALLRLKISDENFAWHDGFGRSFYACRSCFCGENFVKTALKMKISKDKNKLQEKFWELSKYECKN